MRVQWHPRILNELLRARGHYNGCRPGLGDSFVDEFDQRIAAISEAPLQWAKVSGDVRRVLMRRFRYAIFYRVAGPELLLVLVLKHQRRHPKYGFNRRH